MIKFYLDYVNIYIIKRLIKLLFSSISIKSSTIISSPLPSFQLPPARSNIQNRILRRISMDFSSPKTSSPFHCILFDLDDTLYSGSIGIPRHMRKNIEDFLSMTCGISSDDACALRAELFRTYGSSLAGLRARGYDVHPDAYHSFVHGRLPYELIKPDPLLRDTLRSIKQTKILFTNSDRRHAKRALERLGIEEETFSRIICFETMNPHLFSTAGSLSTEPVVLKPAVSAIEVAVDIAGFDPRSMLFLDDSERNIAAGKAMGLKTVLVGKAVVGRNTAKADYVLESIGKLRQEIPEIWRDKVEIVHDQTCRYDYETHIQFGDHVVEA